MGSTQNRDHSNAANTPNPTNPMTSGNMIRHDDHREVVPAQVKASKIETTDGMNIAFPT